MDEKALTKCALRINPFNKIVLVFGKTDGERLAFMEALANHLPTLDKSFLPKNIGTVSSFQDLVDGVYNVSREKIGYVDPTGRPFTVDLSDSYLLRNVTREGFRFDVTSANHHEPNGSYLTKTLREMSRNLPQTPTLFFNIGEQCKHFPLDIQELLLFLVAFNSASMDTVLFVSMSNHTLANLLNFWANQSIHQIGFYSLE